MTKNTKMLSISFNSGTLIKLDNLIMSKTTYIARKEQQRSSFQLATNVRQNVRLVKTESFISFILILHTRMALLICFRGSNLFWWTLSLSLYFLMLLWHTYKAWCVCDIHYLVKSYNNISCCCSTEKM
jgi:hypothetical protein